MVVPVVLILREINFSVTGKMNTVFANLRKKEVWKE